MKYIIGNCQNLWLGLLGLIILYVKRMMQNVWRSNLNWDESVPQKHLHGTVRIC